MLEKELPGIGISIPMLVFWDILGPTKIDRGLKVGTFGQTLIGGKTRTCLTSPTTTTTTTTAQQPHELANN